MRKTWRSSKTDSTISLSSRASARRVPNGFSMITRTSASPSARLSRPCSPSCLTMIGKNCGAVER